MKGRFTEMKKLIGVMMALMMIIGLMIPVFASAENVDGNSSMWVNCENGKTLNVREAPDRKSKVLYRIECGKKVDIIENVGNGWAKISRNGKEGFVMTSFLHAKKPGKYEITERDDNFRTVSYKVTAKALNDRSEKSVCLRAKPNKSSSSLRRLAAGDTLQVVAVGKTWSKVIDQLTGRTGFVANDYIVRT